jgi:serine/threonine-protein kinase
MTTPRPPIYNGRYELESQVARGGTAQVYLARDIILGRPVALKVLFPELSTDHAFVERFRREAQAAASLSHPNIVPVYDWGESDDTYFIVMEYVDGEPLASIIHTQAPITPGSAAQVAADIAKALSYAHRHGVVHRDVKPGNVLITSDGQVKVTDFGIARAMGNIDDQVTQTGLVMGTATYFSPEQAQGLDVDGRSDIYALGVVLYEMLVGRPPFVGDTPVSIAYQHVQETPPRPRSLNPDIPPALEAIVLQAIAKLPAERYQTADELRADLERFLRNQTVLATPPSEFAGAPLTEAVPRAATTASAETGVAPELAAVRVRTTTPYWSAAAVVLLISIVLVGVAGGRSLGYFGGAAFVKVPPMKNLALATAEQELKTLKLHYKVDTIVNKDPKSAGVVLGQNPEFPTSVRAGATVTLSVGGKVAMRAVPQVTGLSLAAGTAALKHAGFKYSPTTIPYTVGSTPGQITLQAPTSGTQEIVGSTVSITVVGTPSKKTIPNWTSNETEIQATTALTLAGFNVKTTIPRFSNTVQANDIISSKPAAGTLEPQGTGVTLYISRGPALIVPNLTGETYTDAQTQLQLEGLSIGIGPPTSTNNPALSGLIIGQSPSVGAQLAQGNSVTVSLGELNANATTTTTTTTTTIPTVTTLPTSTPPSVP